MYYALTRHHRHLALGFRTLFFKPLNPSPNIFLCRNNLYFSSPIVTLDGWYQKYVFSHLINDNLSYRLEHPNVVKLHEAYESKSSVYLVMEL